MLAETPAPGPVPHLEIREWAESHGLLAGITTRDENFDLGLFGPGIAGTVLSNWLRFQGGVGARFTGIAIGKQVHGKTLKFQDKVAAGWHVSDGVDGQATCLAGVLLAVTVADCVPVYLAHPPSGSIALLHAGWRGTAAGVLEEGIEQLSRAAGALVRDLVMHCGVSICGTCYEVGPEVIEAVAGRRVRSAEKLDLRAELAMRAERLGLRQVTTSSWCSAHHGDRFFSHRRSNGADGRMLAFLGRPVS